MGNFMLSKLRNLPLQAKTVAFPRGRLSLRAMPASGGIERVDSQTYSWNGLKRGLTHSSSSSTRSPDPAC